jgi:hypothetical protein
LVIFALFRPSLFMDRIYPPFEVIDIQALASGELTPDPGQVVRFHVVRETPYGDRYKLFALETPEPSALQIQGPFGMTLGQDAEDRWIVDTIAFGGAAEQAGMDFDDVVTSIDAELTGRPPKELVYPFGLALLAIVFYSQWRRSRRPIAGAAGAEAS